MKILYIIIDVKKIEILIFFLINNIERNACIKQKQMDLTINNNYKLFKISKSL